MHNPKTTIAGYTLVAAALLALVAHSMMGNLGMGDVQGIVTAIAGVGLIHAADGGT